MNLIPRSFRFWVAALVIMSMGVIDAGPVFAGLAPSHVSGVTGISTVRDADMLMAQRVLENKVVAQKLHDYGLTPAQAQIRLASMSDGDLHTLVRGILDRLPGEHDMRAIDLDAELAKLRELRSA